MEIGYSPKRPPPCRCDKARWEGENMGERLVAREVAQCHKRVGGVPRMLESNEHYRCVDQANLLLRQVRKKVEER